MIKEVKLSPNLKDLKEILVIEKKIEAAKKLERTKKKSGSGGETKSKGSSEESVKELEAHIDKLIALIRKEINDELKVASDIIEDMEKKKEKRYNDHRIDKKLQSYIESEIKYIPSLRKDQKSAEKFTSNKEIHKETNVISKHLMNVQVSIPHFNGIMGKIDEFIDENYQDKWKIICIDLSKYYDNAGSPWLTGGITLQKRLAEVCASFKKEKWKKYDDKISDTIKSIKQEIDESERQTEIGLLGKNYLPLSIGKRDEIIKKAIRDAVTVKVADQRLDAALDEQCKPNKSVWAIYLDMTGKQFPSSGKYDNFKIHVSWFRDSWSRDAECDVSVRDRQGKGADIADELFGGTGGVGQYQQIHATLEYTEDGVGNPHIYWDGAESNWNSCSDRETKWINGAKAALRKALDAKKKEIANKIEKLVKSYGDPKRA